MSRHLTSPDGITSTLLSPHEIRAGDGRDKVTKVTKVTIERLELYLGHPAGVELAQGRVHALSTIRRRQPLYLLPPRPPAVLGRATALETLHQAVADLNKVDLYGPDGAGKSALVAALAHTLDLDHFVDGIVFVTGSIRHQDLLQILFESFYASDQRVKITPQHAPAYLGNLRALIILDDVGLGPKQIDPILDALGNAAMLIAGTERTALGRGKAVPLKGLPPQQALTLFAEIWGRTPTSDERPRIEQLCAALNYMPLPISALAKLTAEGKVSLNRLLTALQESKSWAGRGGDLSVGPALEQMVLDLDAAGRELLTLVAAFSATSVSREALSALTSLPAAKLQAQVEHLKELGLLDTFEAGAAKSPRVSLPAAYRRAVRTWLVDDAARQRVIAYYVNGLDRNKALPGQELPGLVGAIEDCAHNGWLEPLTRLIYPAGRSLAWLGWWAEWQHVLDLTRRAAQAEGDARLEAWAMHQIGSLQGAQGLYERAFQTLRTALNLREASEEETGAALSAHNLQVLDHLAPAPQLEGAPAPSKPAVSQEQADPHPSPTVETVDSLMPEAPAEKKASPSPARRRPLRRIALFALALLALLALSFLGFWVVTQDDEAQATNGPPELSVSWEFGDAWNAYDNETWTQQIIVVAEGGEGDYLYSVDGTPVDRMFEMVLPICQGAEGIIRVKSGDGQTAQVPYSFDSPFCR